MKWALVLTTNLILLFLVGCGGDTAKVEEENDESVVGTPFTRTVKHDTVLMIAHKIKDYDLWKASFDLAQPLREDHGITDLYIYREMTDSTVSLVLEAIEDVKEAKDYVTSQNLEESMKRAGVVGARDLYWMNQRLAYTKPVTDSILMFMSFNVISYTRWEDAFLQDYRDEPDRDFQVVAVMQGIDNPSQVSMLFAVNDHEYVQKMEKNAGFRAKMLAAGVVSYPVTYKLRSMPL